MRVISRWRKVYASSRSIIFFPINIAYMHSCNYTLAFSWLLIFNAAVGMQAAERIGRLAIHTSNSKRTTQWPTSRQSQFLVISDAGSNMLRNLQLRWVFNGVRRIWQKVKIINIPFYNKRNEMNERDYRSSKVANALLWQSTFSAIPKTVPSLFPLLRTVPITIFVITFPLEEKLVYALPKQVYRMHLPIKTVRSRQNPFIGDQGPAALIGSVVEFDKYLPRIFLSTVYVIAMNN